ncbi:MAG: Zn-ribbon domain-containing OB-fold protein [Candidatus Hodarchaeota archaeon]
MTKDLHKTPFNKDFRWNAWKKIKELVPEKSWTWQKVRTGEAADIVWVEQQIYFDMLYTFRLGALSPYAKGLLDGKLFGTKCPKCGDVTFPPRVNCWNLDCDLEHTEWVEMSRSGTLQAWTVCGFSAKSALKKLPFVLAYVLVGKSKTAIANILHIDEPWQTETKMPVIIKLAPEEKRVGNLIDFWFEPDPSWKPSPMNEEKERIKKLCEPVYEWVESMK